jgi:hypothetical protein
VLLPDFRYIYADTNVISNICKEDGLILDFLRHFPPGEENLLCFSTFTLFELSKSHTLFPEFKKLFSLFPCAILYSHVPLGSLEIEVISGKNKAVDPVLLTPQGIRVEGKGMSPDSLNLLLKSPSILLAFENIEQKTNELFEEYSNLLSKPEFETLNNGNFSRNKFIDTFKQYELKHRYFSGNQIFVDKNKLAKMKSLEVLAQGVYYKFYSDSKRKFSKNDIVDILIMTTAPYCDTYISESNCIDIYRKIVSMNKCGISTNFLTISDLKT